MPGQTPKPVFLKLGGSLITDKGTPQTPRRALIRDLVQAVVEACREQPQLSVLLGHGSGSFGHVPAKKFGTRHGVNTEDQWRGFAEVWYQASALNRLVIDACHQAGFPAISFPFSSGGITAEKNVIRWDLQPLKTAMKNGLLPVVYGDVAIDTILGGTILSTEDIFVHLAGHLRPRRILLAGEEPGVWADFPAPDELLEKITPADRDQRLRGVQGAAETDVTGGMSAKVHQMLALIEKYPDITVQIFSGKDPRVVKEALKGGSPGTTLCAGLSSG